VCVCSLPNFFSFFRILIVVDLLDYSDESENEEETSPYRRKHKRQVRPKVAAFASSSSMATASPLHPKRVPFFGSLSPTGKRSNEQRTVPAPHPMSAQPQRRIRKVAETPQKRIRISLNRNTYQGWCRLLFVSPHFSRSGTRCAFHRASCSPSVFTCAKSHLLLFVCFPVDYSVHKSHRPPTPALNATPKTGILKPYGKCVVVCWGRA
jgi:hypothetical protein